MSRRLFALPPWKVGFLDSLHPKKGMQVERDTGDSRAKLEDIALIHERMAIDNGNLEHFLQMASNV
jgi:hypothetical protein